MLVGLPRIPVWKLDNSINSFDWALSYLFGHFEKNIQPLLAGKLPIKFAIGFLSVFEGVEDGHRFLHGLMICSMPDFPTKIYSKILLLFLFAV